MCRVDKVAKEYNMLSNDAETKTLTNTLQVKEESETLEQVDCFVYLESCRRNSQTIWAKFDRLTKPSLTSV